MNARVVMAAAAVVLACGLARPVMAQESPAQSELDAKLKQQQEDQKRVEEKLKAQKEFAEKELEEARKKAAAGQGPVGVPGVAIPFTFTNQVQDLGRITDDAPVQVSFKFKNTSDTTVKILNMSGSCGCTVPAKPPKDTFAPGEEGEVTATFNPQNRRGREVKHVYMDTDYQKSPRMEMTFSVETLPRVLIEPMSLYLGEKRKGEAGGQTLTITGRAPGFDITDATLTDKSAAFTFRRLEKTMIKGEDGADLTRIQYAVDLAPGLNLGQYRSALNFTTNDPKKASVNVQISAAVVGELRLIPERLSLVSTQAGQPWFREVRVDHRRGESFAVLGVDLVDLPATFAPVVDVTPMAANPQLGQLAGYSIKVSGTTPGASCPVSGKIIIRTNMKDQETIEVPIMGNIMIASPPQ